MRLLRALLALTAFVLPPTHRSRWREESLAVLIEVHGPRRWRYAADTIVKVPLLAVQFRTSVPAPTRWLSALGGCALIATSAVAVTALALPSSSEDAAEFLLLTAPSGLLIVVAVRSFRTARAYGGGVLPYLLAVLVTVFAGTGPVAAGWLSVVTGIAAVAVVGAVVPGLWLVAVNSAALIRRGGPVILAATGIVAGVGLVGVLLGLQLLTHAPTASGFASTISFVSLALLVLAWPVWSFWTGLRLIRGRTQQGII
ncbi:hypothetical protein [Solwaraspora sp. WMMD792]|uniref:hypothetical protein n=1 Tax=Solwaraspora sp. WMMD792 TaxID=3016099 RepID=UPI00241679AC|nr:hypothetical protein [Solwaraspora sp. WMMD792]MDG4770943.1 hypothetical protein [Solwaraspora sp. WMMD792]